MYILLLFGWFLFILFMFAVFRDIYIYVILLFGLLFGLFFYILFMLVCFVLIVLPWAWGRMFRR